MLSSTRFLVLMGALAGLAAACGPELEDELATTGQSATAMKVAALQYGGQYKTVDSSCSNDNCAIAKMIEQAAAQGATLVVAPEYGLYQQYSEKDPTLGENPGSSTSWSSSSLIKKFSQQAKQLKVYVVIDLQTYATDSAGTKKYNTQVAFGPDGAVVARHHKFELFGGEASSLTPGKDVSVFSTPLGKVGLLICADMYGDLRMHDKLTRVLGARLVAVSSLWTAPASDRWPANYAKNWNVYVAASNAATGSGLGGGIFAPTGEALVLTQTSPKISLATIPAAP